MVDALWEARRVLRVGGLVVDIRPISAPRLIEVVSSSRASKEAEVESLAVAEDNAAANAAVGHALLEAWFAFEQSLGFDFEVYCDTAADLKNYAATGRGLWVPEIAFEDLETRRRERSKGAGPPARLRWHRPSKLNTYRKNAALA